MSSATSTLRLVLVDDHALLRDTLRDRLEDEPNLQVIATCANGAEALLVAREQSPDVLLLDVEMPQINGIEVTRILKQEQPNLKIIALTALDSDEVLVGMITAGADGFCPKTVDIPTLLKAIHLVGQGATYLPPEISTRLRLLMQRGIPQAEPCMDPVNLTQREVEILGWVEQGLSNAEIATRSGISINTVRCHVKNILTKFNVHDRVQAVAVAQQQGLINR